MADKIPARWTGRIELEITEFKEDPSNDAAFGIFVDVKGSGSRCETVRVYFNEDFFPRYFKIRWEKKLPQEEKRILHDKRDLFVRWALLKIEDYLKGRIQGETIWVDYEHDAAWAEKVDKGLIRPQSTPAGEHVFIYNA